MEQSLSAILFLSFFLPFIAFFVILIIGFITNMRYVLNLHRLITYLQEHYPEKYRELQEPSLNPFQLNPKKLFSLPWRNFRFVTKLPDILQPLNDQQLNELAVRTVHLLRKGLKLLLIDVAIFVSFFLILITVSFVASS